MNMNFIKAAILAVITSGVTFKIVTDLDDTYINTVLDEVEDDIDADRMGYIKAKAKEALREKVRVPFEKAASFFEKRDISETVEDTDFENEIDDDMEPIYEEEERSGFDATKLSINASVPTALDAIEAFSKIREWFADGSNNCQISISQLRKLVPCVDIQVLGESSPYLSDEDEANYGWTALTKFAIIPIVGSSRCSIVSSLATKLD